MMVPFSLIVSMIDHRSVHMRLLGSDDSNRLHSDPSAVSDEPVADKMLVLDHNFAIFAETKPQQR
ncbi:MAG: hypothetical protein AAGH78_17945 [Cyanobacteria bacterium P01_H01_bin.58]